VKNLVGQHCALKVLLLLALPILQGVVILVLRIVATAAVFQVDALGGVERKAEIS